jgi:hypothetical protein
MRLSTRLLLCCGLFGLISPTLSHAEKIALLVGVSDYVERPLEGPQHDVVSLKKLLINQWDFPEKNIKTLVNAQATHSNILKELDVLKTTSKKGDHVLIYFSGHGTSALDTDLGLPLPYNSGAFVPYDFDPIKIKKIKTDTELDNLLIIGASHLRPVLQSLDEDRYVTIIVDSCYSGNSTRSLMMQGSRLTSKTRNFPMNIPKLAIPSSTKLIAKEEKYPYKNVISITASSESEPANDLDSSTLAKNPSLSFDQKPHGLLTNVLLETMSDPALNTDKNPLTYSKLLDEVRKRISRYPNMVTQTPQMQPYLLDDSNNLANQPILGKLQTVSANTALETVSSAPVLKVALSPDTLNLKPHLTHLGIGLIDNNNPSDMAIKKEAGKWTLTTGNGDPILEQGDLRQILKRIEAELWINSLTKDSQNKDQLLFTTLPAAKGNGFDSGDLFQFSAKAASDLYFTIFSVDSIGHVHLLYPINAAENIQHSANSALILPPNDQIKVVAPYGIETVIAATTTTPLSNLKDLKVLITDQGAQISHAATQSLESALKNANASFNIIKVRTYPSPQ